MREEIVQHLPLSLVLLKNGMYWALLSTSTFVVITLGIFSDVIVGAAYFQLHLEDERV